MLKFIRLNVSYIRLTFWYIVSRVYFDLKHDLPDWLIAKHKKIQTKCIELTPRVWHICPEFGGSNLTMELTRESALEYAAKLGAIRHVDNETGVIIYKPKEN